MLSRTDYIHISFETNLFFQRIMKEHLFFIETNLPPVETAYIEEARLLKLSFEQLMADTIFYAGGRLSKEVIKSNELVTVFTLRAEEVTSELTGGSINTGITMAELELISKADSDYSENLEEIVSDINARSLNILEAVITFKTKILSLKSQCKIFLTLYDELLDHLILEAIYYREVLTCLQEREIPKKELCEKLNFWNNIMGEHAQFIDGLLDPTEKTLKEIAESFANRFEKLVEECIRYAESQILKESFKSTEEIRDYKEAATEGLLECNIKSIIPPLLADHVLREANHYLRLLKKMKK